MARNSKSKFLELLEEQHFELFGEDSFVKGSEKSELPDMQDDGGEQPPEGEQPQRDEQPEQPAGDVFTDREVDILNVALQLYRDNEQNSIDSMNDFSELFQNEQYEDLLSRMISVADELR
jgi:hypothetical protein